MQQIILAVLAVFPFLFACFFCVSVIKRQNRRRKSPLGEKLLRGPGESLRKEISKNTDKTIDLFFRLFLVFIPPVILFIFFAYIHDKLIPVWELGLVFVLYVVLIFFGTRQLYRLLKKHFNLSLGLDAEQAVGQELNQLMLSGCHVYHDFQAEKFNIDHVVAGACGIFAVETKGRTKPKDKEGKADHNVLFDGQKLHFPGWIETAPLEQAKRQAEWLSKWLTNATGTPIKVQGVLVLPGWYVTRKGTGSVWVMSGKEVYSLKNGRQVCSQQMIQQVSHQLEQRCRDVGPTVYGEESKK
nr:nuclease-related domain-containing protein [uncultured Desulfuromonas sp.]